MRAVEGELHAGERVVAKVDRAARHAVACNHTATHLLHAALRSRLGDHVRQAGSYVGPDKLRFDFTHTAKLSEEDRRHVEDEVNARILASLPVRPITTTLDEARELGAMALFGEKYGDVVRMVEIGDGGAVARAVRRHARADDLRDRALPDHERGLERRQRPAHRGDHRARGRHAHARARRAAARRRRRAAHPARARARGDRPAARDAPGRPPAAGRRTAASTRRRSPRAPRRSPARRCSPPSFRTSTPRR